MEELESEITCAVCHEHYKDPKVFPCCHYYCRQCIQNLARKNDPFPCPECRKDTTIPQGGIDQLPTAFFVNRMKEVHSKLERTHGKVEAKCEMCSCDKAAAFCRHCVMFICHECAKQHQKMKVFVGHKVDTLSELRSGGAKEVMMQASSYQTCKLHEEPFKIYCFDCSSLICRDCTMYDHKDHKHNFVKEVGPKIKEKSLQRLDSLREIEQSLSQAIEKVQSVKTDVEGEGRAIAKEIEDSFAQLHKILEDRKHVLLNEAVAIVAEKLENLSSQEKSLSNSCTDVRSVIDYTNQCVQNSADNDYVCMHADVESRIERELEEQKKREDDLEPVEGVDLKVEVECAKEMEKLCQKARVAKGYNTFEFVLTSEEKGKIEVGQVSVVFLSATKLGKGAIECQLKSLSDGSTVKCDVHQMKDKYHVTFTPTVRGRHELIISAAGVVIPGDPLPVYVSLNPAKLKTCVRTIPNLGYGSDIAINSQNEIVYTQVNADVVVMDKAGNKVRSITKAPYNFNRLTGVAVDEEDNVYITDEYVNMIYKFSKEMKMILNVKNDSTTGHLAVAVIQDKVMVCPKNKHSISVYSRELKHLREIILPGKGEFCGVASDEDGNLYASDVTNSDVVIFSSGGKHLRSFKVGGQPHGVCIAGQNVYVSDWSNHSVSVYTTQGVLVTAFGTIKCFKYPWGMCLDRDGFLYVCDCNNMKIQVF